MSVLSCNNICLAFGTDVILNNINFSINAGSKLGVVGANGAGKSTLLKIINGEIDSDSGSVSIAGGLKCAKLEQYTDSSFAGMTAMDVAFTRFTDLISLEEELQHLEALLQNGDESTIEKYTALRDRFTFLGGYEYKSKACAMMKKLGFNDDDLRKEANTLSGGQKTRLSLAALFMCEPDIILLDEPTNHLDVDAAIWLEEQIRSSNATFIIVSHDRYFLDRTTTDTLEIENSKGTIYSGGYSLFKEKKKKLAEDAQKHYQLQQKEFARLEAFIENQRKWNRERNIIAAESRMKAIARMDKLERPENAPSAIKINIESERKGAYDVLSVRGLSKSFGAKQLFTNLTFELKKKDKQFIVGGNGTGKSTLLKIINGVLSSDSGVVELGYNQQCGYYDQEQMLLNDSLDVITELWNAYPSFNQTELRSALARYGFRGNDVFKTVSNLSGGEKARLAIAKLVLSGASLLILDEPTNYLDIPSKEVLEAALNDYSGTLLCVSHDRYLISSLATKILDIDARYEQGFMFYNCGYDEYLKQKPRFAETAELPKKLSCGAEDYLNRKKEISNKRKEEKLRAKLEKCIADAEQRLSDLEQLSQEHATDYVRLAEIEEEKASLENDLLRYYDKLLELI